MEFENTYSNPLSYAHKLFINGELITDLVIPETVKSIGQYAFTDCKSLTNLKIGNSVETIGFGAFRWCYGLNSLELGQSIIIIDDCAFEYCKGVKNIELPNSLLKIGSEAFWGCGFQSITIPNSVEEIGLSAFSDLKTLNVIDGDKPFSWIFHPDWTKEEFSIREIYLGRSCKLVDYGTCPWYQSTFGLPFTTPHLEDLTIGNSVKEIGSSEWSNCASLEKLSLGSNIKKIGDDAFLGCSNLKTVVFPPSLDSIGTSAFAGSKSLDTIIMGHNVKTIGKKAFDGCPANTVCVTAQTPPTSPNTTFSNYTGKLWVQDPGDKSVLSKYANADSCWNNFRAYAMIVPEEMKYQGPTKIEGKGGDTFQLSASLWPDNVTLPQIFWRSTNPTIATVDHNGLVTLHDYLEENESMSLDVDKDDNSCKIIAESLYANGPVAEFTIVNTDFSGVDNVIVDGKDKNSSQTDIDYSEPYEIFNLSGMRLGNSMESLKSGIYIVRQGKITKKVAL